MKRLVIFKFPYESCLGGSELQMQALIQHVQRNVEVLVYTNCPQFQQLCLQHHIPFKSAWFPKEPVSLSSILSFPLKAVFGFCVSLLWVIQEKMQNKETVFLCCNLSEKLFLGMMAPLCGIKTFFLETTSIQRWLTQNPYRMVYRLNTFFSKVLCVSQQIKTELITMKVKENQINVIYPGVDTKKFCPATEKQGGYFTIGCVARLEKEKGIDVLLQAVKKVSIYLPNLRVIVIGEGSQREELSWLSKQLQLSHVVTFVGQRNDVQEWMKHFSLFVLPSKLREAFGIAAAEAMACGVCVIASNLGGIPELVTDGVTGVLVQPNSAAELSNQILLLAHDEELRLKLADAAQKRIIESFSLPLMLEAYEKTLFG